MSGLKHNLVRVDQWRRRKAFSAAGAQVGKTAVLARHTTLTGRTVIADNVWINGAAQFRGSGRIDIGSWCAIGDELLVTTTNHDVTHANMVMRMHWAHGFVDLERPADVEIGSGCWIGDRVTILGGARIGVGCVIAAGAVVPGKEYPPYSILGGVPARIIRRRAPSSVIEVLVASAWWTWSSDRQARNITFFNADITTVAAEQLRRSVAR